MSGGKCSGGVWPEHVHGIDMEAIRVLLNSVFVLIFAFVVVLVLFIVAVIMELSFLSLSRLENPEEPREALASSSLLLS